MIKTYYDYIKEIKAHELYEGLMLEGIFSERIIPLFTMNNFFTYVKSLPKTIVLQNKDADYIRYKANRNNQLPRMLGIPSPFQYEKLCKELEIHWDKIQKYFLEKTKNNKHKISQVHLRKMKGTKKLVDLNYHNFKTDDTLMDDLRIGKKYIVKADISNCYPSIYTHAIPWALVGKEIAKNNKASTEWYNSIDFNVRNLKLQETHGILIGPHTSNVISEIILCSIDEKLSKYTYTRHIDDYLCYCQSENEAEEFIEDLQKELGKYDLLLNNKKTKIIKMPINTDEEWINKLKSYKFEYYNDEIKYNSLKMFFNLVDLLVEQTNNISIIYYAWKIINDIELTENSKKLFFKLARYYIYHFPYLFPFFEKQIIEKLHLSNEEIKLIVNENLRVLIEKNNYEGISYCLYYVYKYKIEITSLSITLEELYDFAVDSNDCIVLLIASLCVKNIKNEYKKYKNFAREILKNDDISRYWLFCYEVLTQSDLKSEWTKMKKNGVSFIAF